jgi:hypothetical protein
MNSYTAKSWFLRVIVFVLYSALLMAATDQHSQLSWGIRIREYHQDLAYPQSRFYLWSGIHTQDFTRAILGLLGIVFVSAGMDAFPLHCETNFSWWGLCDY